MKSKRAKEYIEERVFDAADLVDADGVGCAVVRRSDAVEAVERAEQDAEGQILDMTLWRNSMTEKPENGEWVLVKVDNPLMKYTTATYFNGTWMILGSVSYGKEITWRHIYEYKLISKLGVAKPEEEL